MQLIKAQSALLSNYEVLRLIEERQQVQNETKAQDPDSVYPENLLTIQHEVHSLIRVDLTAMPNHADPVAAVRVSEKHSMQYTDSRASAAVFGGVLSI